MSHFPKRAKRKNFPPSSHTIPLPRSIIYSGLAAWNERTVYPHNLIWASALGTLARNLYLPLAIFCLIIRQAGFAPVKTGGIATGAKKMPHRYLEPGDHCDGPGKHALGSGG